MRVQAILNADWGRNISVTRNFESMDQAKDKFEEIKNDFGDPEIETKIVSIRKLGGNKND